MLSAVQFDNQPGGGTEEIRNVWPDRLLTPKPHARQLLAAKPSPELAFRVRRHAAHVTRPYAV
jgi:hypothetical protein